MKRLFLVILINTLLPFPGISQNPALEDRVEVHGGAVLTGKVIGVEGLHLLLETDYAGILQVQLDRVDQVQLFPDRETNLPANMLVQEEQQIEEPLVANKPSGANPKPIEEAQPEKLGGWELEAGLNLSGQSGNTERFNSRVTLRAELERQYDRLDLYGRYSYNTSQGKLKSDEIILGGRYTNFFYKKTGMFFREELEKDPFEEIDLRSTSALGISYRFKQVPDLKLEGRVGLSYRYEDYRNNGYETFPGMEYGVDIFWQFVDWASFKGSYTYVPSVRRLDSYIIQGDTGLNLPLKKSDMWKLRLGIFSQYNSTPDTNRENTDLKYYAELIASWR